MEAIQQKLRELEIAAHEAGLPMQTTIALLRRQIYLGALARCRGNVKAAAKDIGRSHMAIYQARLRMKTKHA